MRVKAGIAERAIAGQVAVGVEGFREWLLTPYPAPLSGPPLSGPPYSPNLNPIEMIFSKIKQLLRTLEARTREALWDAMQGVLDQVTPADAGNCFRHAGYTLGND
jgi:hypothetical protein